VFEDVECFMGQRAHFRYSFDEVDRELRIVPALPQLSSKTVRAVLRGCGQE
jgi:hypothetical protein